jgi:hypothetical protein
MVLYPLHFYVSWPARLNASVGDVLIAVVGPLWLLGVLGRRRVPRFSVRLLTFVAVAVLATAIALVVGAPYVRFEDTVLEFGKLLGAIAWFLGAYAVLVDDAVAVALAVGTRRVICRLSLLPAVGARLGRIECGIPAVRRGHLLLGGWFRLCVYLFGFSVRHFAVSVCGASVRYWAVVFEGLDHRVVVFEVASALVVVNPLWTVEQPTVDALLFSRVISLVSSCRHGRVCGRI